MITKGSVVKQGHKLVNARYKLNTNEMKLILFAISEISKNDPDDYVYKIKISELGNHLDNESLKNKHTRLKEFCESLLRKPLYIPDDTGGFLIATWFSSLRYVPGVGELHYRISTDLKPFLIDLQRRFIQYNLSYILPLTSTYSIRVYQLLKEYQKIGHRKFDLKELQTMLDVPQSLKALYSNFKLRVLAVAQREINTYTDINFDYEEIKSGKKVVTLKFIIKSAPEQSQSEHDTDRISVLLKHVPDDFKSEAKKVLLRFLLLPDDVIISNIRLTNSDTRESYAAFLTSALKNDYAVNNRTILDTFEAEDAVSDEPKYVTKAKVCYSASWLCGKPCSRGKGVQFSKADERCMWCATHQLHKHISDVDIQNLIL